MSNHPPRIVTDSASDIPPAIARDLDITVIPCQIHIAGETYLDGIDISCRDLHRRMRNSELFSTSQPAVGVFAETYRRLMEGGREVLAVHLGATFSGLCSTAHMAAAEVDPARITVIDSQQVSMCLGWLAVQAAEAAREGRSRSEIAGEIQGMLPRLRLFALIDDLRFLHHGGRVGWVSSLIGQLFAVKPIILVKEGRADLAEKVRSLSRGLGRLAALGAGLGPLERLAVLHADAPAAVSQLADLMAPHVPGQRILVTEAGAIISAHAGPGAVAFACVVKA